MRSVSVIGIGETKMGNFPDRTLRDLIEEAGNKAIEDAGIGKEHIQCLYMGNFNSAYLANQNHIGPLASEVLELGKIPTVRTEGACASGSLAFRQGLIGIASGMYDVVLIGGVEKMTHRQTEEVTAAIASAADFQLESQAGVTFPSIFAMIANRYFHEFRNVRDEMAMCSINSHYNASLNEDAQLQKIITMDKVKSGFEVADPFTVYDCSLVTDGAAFIVLAATDIAKKISNKRVVEVIGSGHAGDSLTLASKKSITTFPATIMASLEAYRMAGLKSCDIDFAEVHDCFSITQIINIEDLGFFKKGKGGDAVAEGKIVLNGEMPINVSGGLKAKGHPIGATGLSQIFEIVTQLRGDAGSRQLKKADIGLSHNLGGTGATCVVNIFRGV